MPSKKEYEELFNKVLGTDIKWSKLSKDELVQIATLLNNPEILLQRLGVKFTKTLLRDKLIDAGLEILDKWEGPLVTALKKLLKED